MYRQKVIRRQHDEMQLVENVVACLQKQLGGQLRNVRVTIEEDGLVLDGRVTTYYGKQVAQHVAMQLSEPTMVTNSIEVL